MQTETVRQEKPVSKTRRKVRGIYEKAPGSGIWWIRYADSMGRIRREKAGAKGAAITLYRKRKTEALQSRKLPEKLRRRNVPFSELVADALEYSKAHKRSYRDDVCRMGRIREWFGAMPADGITPRDIEQRLARLANDESLAPATLNRYRSLMSLMFRLGMESGKVAANPARLVRPRLEDNARVRFLSESEEARLRAVIREHWAQHEAEFDIALHTGLRRGGMYKLEWRDVDLERRIVTERLSKSGKTRHVPLNEAAFTAFMMLRRAATGEGRVFPIHKSRHWFEKAVRLAGIEDFHWHDLRHTFASRLTMLGVPLRGVQNLMGHGSILMTARYSHLAPTFEQAAVERLVGYGKTDSGGSADPKTSTSVSEAVSSEPAYVQ
jgi:integrase